MFNSNVTVEFNNPKLMKVCQNALCLCQKIVIILGSESTILSVDRVRYTV